MIKKYCDKCGKEITSVVDIDVNKDKPYAYEEHFELCEDCYKRLKAKDVINKVYAVIHHKVIDKTEYVEMLFKNEEDAISYMKIVENIKNNDIYRYVRQYKVHEQVL